PRLTSDRGGSGSVRSISGTSAYVRFFKRLAVQVWRVEVVLSRDANQREKGIATGVGQGGAGRSGPPADRHPRLYRRRAQGILPAITRQRCQKSHVRIRMASGRSERSAKSTRMTHKRHLSEPLFHRDLPPSQQVRPCA